MRNNPLNFVDPFGLQVSNPGQGAGGAVDAVNDYVGGLTDLRLMGDEAKAQLNLEKI